MSDIIRTELHIEGMTCGACVRHVRTALTRLPGVVSVDVGLEDGRAVVAHDPERTSSAALVTSVRAAGYSAT